MNRPRMTTKDVSCEFYRVAIGANQDRNFVDVVERLHEAHQAIADRNVPISDGFIRIANWQKAGRDAQGTMLRLRPASSARVGSLTSDNLTDIALQPGEILTEFYCFRYYDELKTLVINRNRDAGGPRRLEYYLEQKANSRPLILEQILSNDAWQRIQLMQELTSAELHIAMPSNGAVVETGNEAIDQLARFSQASGAANISVRFSVGHYKRTLASDFKGIFQRYIQEFNGKVTKAELQGQLIDNSDVNHPSEEKAIIDLVTDRMIEKVRITIAGSSASSDDFLRALNTAYERRRDDIRDQFGQTQAE